MANPEILSKSALLKVPKTNEPSDYRNDLREGKSTLRKESRAREMKRW